MHNKKNTLISTLEANNVTEITLFWDILAHCEAHAHIHSIHTH